jgi:hypothetical protein
MVLALALVVSTAALAGQLENQGSTVVAGATGQRQFAFAGPPLCDTTGNLYVRPLAGSGIEVSSIWRISRDGKEITHLRPMDISGWAAAGIQDVALSSDGRAHVLVGLPRKDGQSEQYLLAYDRKGKTRSKPVLLRGLHATKVAAFDSGRYLVAGSSEQAGSTLLVVGGDGVVVTAVKPPDDPAALPTQPQDASEAWSDAGWMNLAELTLVEPTENDQVIVARPTARGPVYRINSSGDVVQHFALVPPPGATGISSIKAAGERLAILYKLEPGESGHSRFVIIVVDLTTGVQVAEYENSLGVFACYEAGGISDRFKFLRVERDGLVIAEAWEP